jgi:hypothetical protein
VGLLIGQVRGFDHQSAQMQPRHRTALKGLRGGRESAHTCAGDLDPGLGRGPGQVARGRDFLTHPIIAVYAVFTGDRDHRGQTLCLDPTPGRVPALQIPHPVEPVQGHRIQRAQSRHRLQTWTGALNPVQHCAVNHIHNTRDTGGTGGTGG